MFRFVCVSHWSDGFLLSAAGVIASVEPSNGTLAGNSSVTITGTNLGSGADITFVSLAGVVASIGNQTAGSVTVLSGNATVQRGDIVRSVSHGNTTLFDGYQYI